MRRITRPTPEMLQRPAQGWSSLVLLLAMLILLGVSIGAARLSPIGDRAVGGSFVMLLVAAGLIGFILARSSLGVVRAHLIGAAIGAILILAMAGAAVGGHANVVPTSWEDFTTSMALLYARVQGDLEGVDPTGGYVPAVTIYLMLGAICWTTAQFSAFSIFRYARGGPAVLAIGIVLFLNLYLESFFFESGVLPVLPQLALFSSLAMLTLMRLQLTQQRYGWARRHIADTGDVSRLFLRTGTFFVAFAVVGASSLTLAATTEEHPISLDRLDGMFGDLSDELSRFGALVGVPGESATSRALDDGFTIQGQWQPGDGTAFRAWLDGDSGGEYWWLQAVDQFDGWRWSMGAERGGPTIGAFEDFDVTPGRWDEPWQAREAHIELQELPWPRTVVSPADAQAVSEPVQLTLIDANDGVGEIEFRDASVPITGYEVTAAVRDYGGGPDGLTAAELQSAGERYPAWVDVRYLQGAGTAEASGRSTRRTADRIKKAEKTPYDRAIAIQDLLRGWDYTDNMVDACGDLNVPECVLTTHQGYCEYYASTMVMVLREMEIPSRVVRGFLPGEPQEDGSWIVENQAFHAWVEAFFPNYGWIRFDPTPPGQLERFSPMGTHLPRGDSGETPRPRPKRQPPATPDPSFPPEPSESPGVVPPEACQGCCEEGCDDGALVALLVGGGIAGLLLMTITGLLLFRLRRLPRGDGGTAYRGIVDLATRLGYGPHPAQTEYEYAASLSETLPDVRDDLYLVTASRVEAAYGGRQPANDRSVALRHAYRRIRTALLRIAIRLRRSR